MKPLTFILIIVIAAAAAFGGWFFARRAAPSKSGGTAREVAYYQSSMHPWIKSDQPGNCTICGMKLTPVYQGEQGFDVNPDVVALSSNVINVINVQTEPVQRRPFERTLRVAGRIEANETRYRVLSAYVDGRIEELFVNYVGAEVEQGEPLATIYSPALLTAEREYLTVLNQTNLSGSARIAPEHERMVEAARQRLKRLGLEDDQIEALREKSGTNFTTRVTAPISGTVVNRAVYEGQYVKEGDKLFEIADFSTMWFRFDVYEQDLPWIQLGQTVQVSSPALGGKTIEGPITFIDPNVNEATRSAKVRVELENPLMEENGGQRRLLYNNLYADGRITLQTPPVLAVSRSAVLQPGDFPRVYVEMAEGAYEPRRVDLGRRGDHLWEIRAGVSEGESVVTQGNMLIDSQAQIFSSGAPHQHAAPAAATQAPTPAHEHSDHVTLSPEQKSAAGELLRISGEINEGLAGDQVGAFNEHLDELAAALEEASTVFAESPLEPAVQKLRQNSAFTAADSLENAREQYMPFSNAAAELALALRNSGARLGAKIFKCPMYPLPGKTAFWVQNQGPIRNPFYGSEMLDCGTEVR